MSENISTLLKQASVHEVCLLNLRNRYVSRSVRSQIDPYRNRRPKPASSLFAAQYNIAGALHRTPLKYVSYRDDVQAQVVPPEQAQEGKEDAPTNGDIRSRTRVGFTSDTLHTVCQILVRPFCSLSQLLLDENGIDDRMMALLSDALKHNNSVYMLSIARNRFSTNGIQMLCDALVDNTTLAELDISHNSLYNEGGEFLALFISQTQTITKLCLRATAIYARGMLCIFEAMRVNSSIKELYCCKNFVLCGDGVKTVSYMLEENTTLTALGLSSTYLYREGGVQIAEGLSKNETLTSLHLDDNELGDAGVLALRECLKHTHSALKHLYLKKNNLSNEGTKQFFKALKHVKKTATLCSIDLSENDLGKEIKEGKSLSGMMSGATGLGLLKYLNLESYMALHTLTLNQCGLNDGLIVKLCISLYKTPQIQVLSLDRNEFAIDGCDAIGSLLEQNTPLQSLSLARNKLNDACVCVVAGGLRVNTSLRSLNIAQNDFHNVGYEFLWAALLENTGLVALNVAKNGPSPDDDLPIAMLKRNSIKLAQESMYALLHGLHPRLGEHCALRSVFQTSSIAHTAILGEILTYLSPA